MGVIIAGFAFDAAKAREPILVDRQDASFEDCVIQVLARLEMILQILDPDIRTGRDFAQRYAIDPMPREEAFRCVQDPLPCFGRRHVFFAPVQSL